MSKFIEDEREKLMNRIRALKALETSSNEHEAALAAQKIQEILQAHNLAMNDIELREPEEKEGITEERVTIMSQREYWKIELAGNIARYNFCNALFTRKQVYFIGRKTDVEVCTFLFNNLSTRLWALGTAARDVYVEKIRREEGINPYRLEYPDHPKSYRTAWVTGAVRGVTTQLQKRFNEFTGTNEGHSLIVVRGNEVERWIKQQYKHLSTVPGGGSTGNHDGFNQGYEAGKTIQMQTGVGGRNGGTGTKSLNSGK